MITFSKQQFKTPKLRQLIITSCFTGTD